MQVTELSGLICQTLGTATAASDEGQPPIVGLYLDTSIAYVIGVLATLRARYQSNAPHNVSPRMQQIRGRCNDGVLLKVCLMHVAKCCHVLCRAAFMPLDARWPPSKLTAVLDDARPAVILWADKACNGELQNTRMSDLGQTRLSSCSYLGIKTFQPLVRYLFSTLVK